MARDLVDLLWREHPAAPGPSRGPRAKVTTTDVVDAAIALADTGGLAAVSVRRLAADVGVTTMSVYTHVGSHADLLVLMADAVHGGQERSPWPSTRWRERVAAVAGDDMTMLLAHPWLLDVTDQRTALGPGTIAKYDHDLHAFDGTGLGDVDRDAALTFVLDYVRAAARARVPDPGAPDMASVWAESSERLAHYVGDEFPLAQRVGAAAGAEMNAPHDADRAWHFGLGRVLDALEPFVEPR
ncbi:TetR/AcrR family transcriptional regulator [Rhodococcus rhodnii]|nr:TetR/AcrR family transcriptional regulator [Rhodococcus rhodnii]TXG92487.1 TetR/AcrR family transcriptional regulator [Rhodococcus rhodnii]